jgi:hypothetical protein
MSLQNARGRYCAATLSLLSEPDPARPARNVLEAKWAPRRLARVYEVPCILGASYGFSTAWFHRIRGLEGLRGWGTQEPFLSLKTWLAGGRCKILAHLEIGHKFRDRAPYRTRVADLYYNKLFVCATVLPEAVADRLVARLPPGPALDAARRAIESAAELVREHRRYYESIFIRPFDEYCRRFGIRVPGA